MKRTKIVPVRLTEEEYEAILENATKKGLKVSTLIRTKLYENNLFKREEDKNEEKD